MWVYIKKGRASLGRGWPRGMPGRRRGLHVAVIIGWAEMTALTVIGVVCVYMAHPKG